MAQRRLPRVVFDLLGASEDGRALRKNLRRLGAYSLVPKSLMGGSAAREQGSPIFGEKYSSFFGIAPTGVIGLVRQGVEISLAQAAAQAKIPMILSGASTESLERIAATAPGMIWSQLYSARDQQITADLLARARDCGVKVLVWTIDMPVSSKNDSRIRNGLTLPPRVSVASKLDALLHPAWLRDYFSGGLTRLGTWERYAPANSSDIEVLGFFMSQRFASETWHQLDVLRRLWKGPLVVKGVLRGEDALRMAECGVDGVIVSNHGGFGLDRAPAPIDMLPGVVAAAGEKLTVMFDGGIRRGSDAVVALCLGAKFVFTGRATLYGAIAGGTQGAARAIEILIDEIDRTLGYIGCLTPAHCGAHHVRAPEPSDADLTAVIA